MHSAGFVGWGMNEEGEAEIKQGRAESRRSHGMGWNVMCPQRTAYMIYIYIALFNAHDMRREARFFSSAQRSSKSNQRYRSNPGDFALKRLEISFVYLLEDSSLCPWMRRRQLSGSVARESGLDT